MTGPAATDPEAGVGAAPSADDDRVDLDPPAPTPRGPIARLRGAGRDRWSWWLGLLGVVLLVGGSGWYQVWVNPPYRAVDEQAHVGYVQEVLAGRLPTIDTPIDTTGAGPALQARLDREPERRRDVWVANNPPLPYVIAAGPAWITRSLDLTGGPLLGLRLVNLAASAAAVVFLARLATTLAGGDRRIGLVAAGLFAASPHVGFMAGLGFTDGLALLASFAMLDALATWCRRAPTRRDVAVLAAWCAFGSAVRPMTAVLAGAVLAGAGVVTLWRRPGWRRVVRTALVLGVPTLLASGWWYRRNIQLYGDATGSDRLLEKFMRKPRRSPIHMLEASDVWREVQRTLFFRRLENQLPGDHLEWWVPLRWSIIVVLLVGLALVVKDQVLALRSGRQDRSGGPVVPRTPALSWLAAVGGGAVSIALTAQHWSGGGTPHARYVFPAFALLCTVIALVAVRLGTRWLGLALVAGFLAIQGRQVPIAVRWVNDHPSLPFRLDLYDAIGPSWWRLLGAVGVVVGFVALVAAVALLPKPGPEAPTELAAGS